MADFFAPFVYYRYSGNKLNTIFSMTDYSVLEFSYYQDINTYQTGFYTDDYGTNTRAEYYSEMESPDGRLVTKGITHLLKNNRIGQKNYDCLYQITQASKRGNQNIRSKKELFVDLKGKTL